MADPLAHSRYSINRAKGHICDLEGEAAAFRDNNPCTTLIETNEDGTKDIYKVRLTKGLPDAVAGLVFDAANNLRASLDQAGYAVAIAAGQSGKHAHFPFGATENEVRSRNGKKGPSREIPKDIFDVMVSLKPYKGGNTLLWAVNELSNTQKHEIVIPIAMAAGSMTIKSLRTVGGAVGLSWPRWDGAKNEMEIFRTAHGATPEYNFNIAAFIVIGKVEEVEGQPAIAILHAMAGIVESGLMAIEGEARRIGVFS